MGEEKFFRNELATLLEYSTLLKKERNPDAEEAIQRILQEEKNIIARINRIKEVDKEFPEEPTKESTPPPELELPVREKLSIKKISFFSYFFSYRKSLIQMSNETSILVPKFLGLKFNISEEMLSLLEEIRTNVVNHILPFLQKILENGWKILSPGLYNIFYYYYRLFNELFQNFTLDKKDLQKNMEFIDCFLNFFLMVIQHKKYLQDTREAVYLFSHNKENEEMANFLLFIEGMLDRKKKFSFLNYVLMVYSASYRQMLSLQKLLELKDIDSIPSAKYLTIQKVKYMLQDYQRQLQAKQKINEKKLFYLKHIQDEDPKILENFIKSYHSPKFKLEFFTGDLLKSCEAFLKAFLNYTEPILMDEVHLHKEGKVEKSSIFKMIWESTVTRLESLFQEVDYQRETHKYLFITLSTYDQFKNQNGHLESEKDEKLCTLIEKLTEEFSNFFEVMTQILYHHYYLTYYEEKENIFDKLKTRNKPIAETETERFIPFSDYQVKEYNDENVLEILTYANTAVGTFLHILGQSKVLDRLREKNSLMEVSKSNLDQILRLKF